MRPYLNLHRMKHLPLVWFSNVKNWKYIGFFCLIVGLSSCGTRKKMVYFQEPSDSLSTTAIHQFTPVFEVDDLLQITITAEDQEAAKAFNQIPTTPTSANNGYLTGVPANTGYLVDAAGNIQLPVLGKLSVAGKNRMELVDTIQQRLVGYLKNPTVQIQIQNFKVTVLGGVQNPGTFKIPNERITLLEAIGLAGDLKMTGVRKNVLVLRDSMGVKKEYRIDLTKKELFDSPVYYLKQNDVVYVEPNAAGRSEGTVWRTTGSIFISITSLVVTSIALILK